MYSSKSPFRPGNFFKCQFSAGISILFIFLIGFVFQGCVVHKHSRGSGHYAGPVSVQPRVAVPAPVVFTFTDHHRRSVHNYYHDHPRHHGNKHKWKHKRNSHLHSGIKMQVIPVYLARQLPPAPRGTRYIYDDDQILLVNVSTRRVVDFINIPVSVEDQDAYTRKPSPKRVNQMPSYEGQRPDHQPPSHAQAYEVARGKPFTEDEHPSSHGQGHNGNRGKPDIDEDHPSSHGQGHKVNRGKPDMGEDHPSQHAKNDRDHGPKHDQGKPLWGDDSPSSQGQKHGMNKGKPDKGGDHPSSHAQMDKGHQGGGPNQGMDRPSSMGQGNQGRNKGGPPEDKDRPSTQAKVDQGHQGGQQQGRQEQQEGPPKGHDRPSQGKGKPSMENPEDSGSHQMDARGKPDKGKPKNKGKQKDTFADSSEQEDSTVQSSARSKGKGKPDKGEPKGKGKQKDTFADSSEQEDSTVQSSARSKGKGKPSKQDHNSARGPSGQEDTEQFQPNSTPEENIQVAKVEKGRGKGNSKGPGKGNKRDRGKPEQQTDMTAAVTQQEPAPSMTSPEPATTASFVPSVFDNNQRSIIQSYYQNSGSKKSGKGKPSRGSKGNKSSSVAKNDILTQPTEPLPRSLESQLPPAPPNSKRVLYNQQVLLVEKGTHRVLDVINVNN